MVQQIVAQQNLLTLARQGDPNAIASLVNQVLWQKGMTATAKTKGSCLHIVIVADRVPDLESCVRFIYDGVMRLKPKSLKSVRLYGRRSDQKWPAWTETFELKPNFPPTPARSRPPIVTPVPQPKRTLAKLKSKYKKRIPLLLFGMTIWVMVAALGVAISYQLNPPPTTTAQKETSESLDSLLATASKRSLSKSTPQKSKPKSPLVPFTSPVATPTPKAQSTPPTPNLAPVPPSPVNSQTSATAITIKAVGDIVPGTNFPNYRLPNKNAIFQNVKSSLQGADLLFGNFESTLTNYPRTAKDTSRAMVHAFRTPPDYASVFKETGFDVLSVANNHSLDFFPQGFEDTMKNIEKVGVNPVGKKNQILYMNVKNVRTAFIGFSHLELHNSINDLGAAKALVLEAKQNADIVVISFHGGAEGTGAMRVRNQTENFYGENRGNLVRFSRTMIDNGADLVLGHGPHVARAMELYKGKLIAYSLGNFVGYRTLSTWGALGHSLILEVQLDPQGDFIEGKIIPVQLDRRGIPYLDKQYRSVGQIRNLTQMDFPNTPLKIDSKGRILKVNKG